MADQPDTVRFPSEVEPSSRLLVRGLTWTVAYQLFEVLLSFGSMMVMVRILHAADYGRAAAVTGIVALINTFNAHLFVEHALQLPEGEQPDWELHWCAAIYIQLGLSVVCHGVAGLCWLSVDYRPMAGLLHLAAFGLMVDAPSLVGVAMLRRDLEIKRLRLVGGLVMFLRLTIAMLMAIAGAGAYALVLGNNVIPAVIFATDLLLVRRWRPRSGWYRRAWWTNYADPARFGILRAGAQLIVTARGALEAALLPIPLGFAAMGLISRAQVLFSNTFGRAGIVIADVVYPFLPRARNDPARYASHATLYLQAMLIVSVPSALFVAQQGPLVSRVLYGGRWVTMDPLIRPGSIVGLAVSVLSVAAAIMLAAGRVRECLWFEGMAAVGALPALMVAWVLRDSVSYSWACAVFEGLVATLALWRASTLLKPAWFRTTVAPPFVAAAGGLLVLRLCPLPAWTMAHPIAHLACIGGLYGIANLTVMRAAFSESLDELLAYAPAGNRLRRLVRLRTAEASLATPMIPEL
jgi:O-antigen/teichoic acid export membrane protein